MKHRFLPLLFCLTVLCSLAVPASAAALPNSKAPKSITRSDITYGFGREVSRKESTAYTFSYPFGRLFPQIRKGSEAETFDPDWYKKTTAADAEIRRNAGVPISDVKRNDKGQIESFTEINSEQYHTNYRFSYNDDGTLDTVRLNNQRIYAPGQPRPYDLPVRVTQYQYLY